MHKPLYIMSEPHLSGHRVILGFDNLSDAQDAHAAIATSTSGMKAEGRNKPNSENPNPHEADRRIALEAFVESVATVRLDDIDLEYAITNLAFGRGALDKKTKRDAITAIKTLRDIINAAKARALLTTKTGE